MVSWFCIVAYDMLDGKHGTLEAEMQDRKEAEASKWENK